MKNILMVSLAFLLFGFTNSKAQNVQKIDTAYQPEILFETTFIDYGTIEFDSDGHRDYKFKNVGKGPLIIISVSAPCGCEVTSWPKEPIMPGKSGVIKYQYDTKRVGPFSKSQTVTSNAKNGSVQLKEKGIVLPPKKEEPVFPFGK